MIVAELMTPKPVTVTPGDSLELAYEKMKAGRFRQVPVLEEGKLVGILTDRDVRQHLGQLTRAKVNDVMSALPLFVRPSTPVEQAAHLLTINKVGSLPVVENEKLVGIITATDMLQSLEAILGSTSDGSVRIDLGVSGSGEISAAISLVRTICQVLCMGTYSRKAAEGDVLYVRVTASGAERAARALVEYGFNVLAVHHESDLRFTNESSPRGRLE
jgi:acetoin utilization protein AcuB